MPRSAFFTTCLALVALAVTGAGAQSVFVYQTTPDLLEALSERQTLHFSAKPDPALTAPLITVDDAQQFQVIDGFGASLTDSAAWLFAKKLTPAQTDAAFKTLFSRKSGIALSFLRQPIGSSDLAVTFYSYDDLCQQSTRACTTPTTRSPAPLSG
jgi:glucosylceramidase